MKINQCIHIYIIIYIYIYIQMHTLYHVRVLCVNSLSHSNIASFITACLSGSESSPDRNHSCFRDCKRSFRQSIDLYTHDGSMYGVYIYIYANMTGVYGWDPWHTIYSSIHGSYGTEYT